jgi:predicted nucleic acid-binding protein
VLAGIQLLDVLTALYHEVWIPDVVAAEYQRGIKPGEPVLNGLSWVRVQRVVVDPALSAQMDPGEAATLSLAITTSASLVLLDDRQARRVAQQLGLPIIGSLGVLVRAKRRGLVSQVAPLLDQMATQGRYISSPLRDAVLRDAEEPGNNP